MKRLLLSLTILLGCVISLYAGFLGGSSTYYYVGYIANGMPYASPQMTIIEVSLFDVDFGGQSYNIQQYQKTDGSIGERVYMGGLWYTLERAANQEEDYGYCTLTCGGISLLYVSDRDVAEQLRNNVNEQSAGSYAPNPAYSGRNNSGGSYNSSNRRTCPGCNGTGKGPDQITYSPDYTGNNNVYCSACGRTMSRHSHHQPMCRTCYGKGYLE